MIIITSTLVRMAINIEVIEILINLGMNGVLVNNNWPSFLTCEEIDDYASITIEEISVTRKWREIKNAYSEWNFREFYD